MVSYLFLFQCNHLIPCYFFYRISVFIRFFFYPSLSSFILSLHWNCFFSLLLPCFFCIFLHSPSKLKDKYLLSLWLSTRSSSYCHLQIKKSILHSGKISHSNSIPNILQEVLQMDAIHFNWLQELFINRYLPFMENSLCSIFLSTSIQNIEDISLFGTTPFFISSLLLFYFLIPSRFISLFLQWLNFYCLTFQALPPQLSIFIWQIIVGHTFCLKLVMCFHCRWHLIAGIWESI